MWQLFDIAYVFPATVALGYGLAWLVEKNFAVNIYTPAIIISALLGLILFFQRIRNFVSQQNSQTRPETQEADKSK